MVMFFPLAATDTGRDSRSSRRRESSTASRRHSSVRRRLRVAPRSEEHTSELQSLMRISYAVFCLKKNNKTEQAHSCTQLIRQHMKKAHQLNQNRKPNNNNSTT